MKSSFTSLLGLGLAVAAQQVGNNTIEVHPRLTTWRCTHAGGCTPRNTAVVLDANYRWIHTVGGYQNCNGADGNSLDKTLCPDAATCARNCALEGTNYTATGIYTSSPNATSSSLTLDMYVNGQGSSPRVYLLGEDDNSYESLQLNNAEFTFEVDMSQLPCGMNGALYLSEMSMSGGKSSYNRAGAAMGTGYCDAQCPIGKFINGEANTNGTGSCCNEMDIWEANSRATALTPHACSIKGIYACSGTECLDGSSGGVCDRSGCGYNAYAQGHRAFYGPGKNMTVDTSRPFTVVTQFLAGHGNKTSHGSFKPRGNQEHSKPVLREIRRLYLQDGILISNVSTTAPYSNSSAASRARTSKALSPDQIAISDEYCGSGVFEKLGGLRGMGEALQRGMVLVFSIWNDNGQYMSWLDGGNAGPCNATEGAPDEIFKNTPGTSVTWSNVRWGEIGSTFRAGCQV
ncbi:endo- -beta-glucanase [Ophiostoma piceae UAMH 11346]|uniref:Glucanase n=1 Tax=Ophiostoma piceae (strain UAMH 11346) TaxID=1262450 RepID=S3CAD2_OPHP1|nr:endo- -beta-glucanase [Ophiostoma piceae UAMH 11346]